MNLAKQNRRNPCQDSGEQYHPKSHFTPAWLYTAAWFFVCFAHAFGA